MSENFKELDRKKIMDYVASREGEVAVEQILSESGAEKVRVYPIIFEEVQAGHLEVTESEPMGAPRLVRIKQ